MKYHSIIILVLSFFLVIESTSSLLGYETLKHVGHKLRDRRIDRLERKRKRQHQYILPAPDSATSSPRRSVGKFFKKLKSTSIISRIIPTKKQTLESGNFTVIKDSKFRDIKTSKIQPTATTTTDTTTNLLPKVTVLLPTPYTFTLEILSFIWFAVTSLLVFILRLQNLPQKPKLKVSTNPNQRSPMRSPMRKPKKTIGKPNGFHLNNSSPASPNGKRINPKSPNSIVEGTFQGSAPFSLEGSDESGRHRRSSSMSLEEKLNMLKRSMEEKDR